MGWVQLVFLLGFCDGGTSLLEPKAAIKETSCPISSELIDVSPPISREVWVFKVRLDILQSWATPTLALVSRI